MNNLVKRKANTE